MSIKKYASFFRIRFLNGLQYRVAAAAGISTQFAFGFMNILLFAAFYRANPSAFPITFRQTASYIWLQQAMLALYMMWYFDNDIFESVLSGGVAYDLCRPMSVYGMWFVKSLAYRFSSASLRCVPVLVVAMLLPAPYSMGPPAGVFCFLLFLVSLFLAFFLVVAFGMLVYISCFYMVSASGIRIIVSTAAELLTGQVIPLPFFPEPFRGIVQLLPFAYMQNAPFLIYGGSLSPAAALQTVGMQLFWLVVLVAAGRVWIKYALQKVVVQGG